jgi:hypothetical protein
MGLLDIIYQTFRDYNEAIENEDLQKELAQKAFKQTFKLFYYDWVTLRDSGIDVPKFTGNIERMLRQYSSTMLQVLTELDDSLSTPQKEQLLEFITEFRKISNLIEVMYSLNIVAKLNELAEKAKEIFNQSSSI